MNADLATPASHFRNPGRYIRRSGQPIACVSTRLPEDLLQRLAAFGNQSNLSMSQTVRLLLERGLDCIEASR